MIFTEPTVSHAPFPALKTATQKQASNILNQFLGALPLEGRTGNYDEALTYLQTQSPAFTRIVSNLQRIATGAPDVDYQVLERAQGTLNAHLDNDGCDEKVALALKTAIYDGMKPEIDFTRSGWNRARGQTD